MTVTNTVATQKQEKIRVFWFPPSISNRTIKLNATRILRLAVKWYDPVAFAINFGLSPYKLFFVGFCGLLFIHQAFFRFTVMPA
jgi:hypothetical protein